jgi:hypothetical protein
MRLLSAKSRHPKVLIREALLKWLSIMREGDFHQIKHLMDISHTSLIPIMMCTVE